MRLTLQFTIVSHMAARIYDNRWMFISTFIAFRNVRVCLKWRDIQGDSTKTRKGRSFGSLTYIDLVFSFPMPYRPAAAWIECIGLFKPIFLRKYQPHCSSAPAEASTCYSIIGLEIATKAKGKSRSFILGATSLAGEPFLSMQLWQKFFSSFQYVDSLRTYLKTELVFRQLDFTAWWKCQERIKFFIE